MFRNMSREEHLSGGQSSASSTAHGVPSAGLNSQESSWIGLFSVVSRPALSFLQKILPGRPRTTALVDKGSGWLDGDQTRFANDEGEFLRQLDDMMPQHPTPHLTYLECQHDGAVGLLEPKAGRTLPWLTADSLRELGLESAAEIDFNLCQQTQIGYFSSVRTLLSHVLLSSQEMKQSGGRDWVSEEMNPPVRSGSGTGRTWWGSFWGGEESLLKGSLSDLSWPEVKETGQLYPQPPPAETKAPPTQTSPVFVQSGCAASTLGENAGVSDHKEELANSGSLHTVQNAEGATAAPQPSISSDAATAYSEVALLTPDQDNGYSSLEEEHVHMSHLYLVKTLLPQEVETLDSEMEPSEGVEAMLGKLDEEEATQEEEQTALQEGQSVVPMGLAAPECQNKAIAFIMGCPCSDDDDSSVSDSSDDDDGFDSEGSSDLSDSTDEDDEDGSDSDGELDSEAERLWSSLCQSGDPYNPRSFTARLHTSSTCPRPVPASTPLSSTQSSPASSPDLPSLPFSSLAASLALPSSSPPSGHDVWDDSTSASEADEAESLRLWNSFSCSSDPYSPFNFQATLRTQQLVEAPRAKVRAKKASQTPQHSPHHNPASPPEYRKEGAEERLDSGFCEPATSQSCSATKKVRFCDDVEEFFASCGEEDEEEDRRGPWEELARDRCRFLRRCQEVEQSIAFCLQPLHRSRMYQRLTVLHVQDA